MGIQRYDAESNPLGTQTALFDYTEHNYSYYRGGEPFKKSFRETDIQYLQDGGFVFSWVESHSCFIDDKYTVINRIVFTETFDENGVSRGNRTELYNESQEVNKRLEPDTEVLANGDYVVTWNNVSDPLLGMEISARIFDPSGVPVSEEFAVNTPTLNRQRSPDVVALEDGGFVIVHSSFNNIGGDDLVLERFDADGARVGETIVANSLREDAWYPEIVNIGNDQLAVVWHNTANFNPGGTIQTAIVSLDGTVAPQQRVDGIYGDMATDGSDDILGGFGDDSLNGLSGNDVLTGGDGDDLFVFTSNSGDDIITDFVVSTSSDDRLDFSQNTAVTGLEDLTISDADNGALIEFDGNSILLLDVSSSSLTEDDYLF